LPVPPHQGERAGERARPDDLDKAAQVLRQHIEHRGVTDQPRALAVTLGPQFDRGAALDDVAHVVNKSLVAAKD